MINLRILAIHGAKITKKQIPPVYVLLDYFTTRQSFKNLYDPFLTKWPEMLKLCKHLKSPLNIGAERVILSGMVLFMNIKLRLSDIQQISRRPK